MKVHQTTRTGRLWAGLIAVLAGGFAVLGYYGYEIYRNAPPIPQRIVTTEGRVLYTAADIHDGQNVWQSMGGQEVGSIWGHGSYVAPVTPLGFPGTRFHLEAPAPLNVSAV